MARSVLIARSIRLRPDARCMVYPYNPELPFDLLEIHAGREAFSLATWSRYCPNPSKISSLLSSSPSWWQ